MKPLKQSLSRALLLRVLLCVYLPLILITVLAVVLPYRETNAQHMQEYTQTMKLNGNRIAEHVSYVTQSVTLLEDSQPLREALKSYDASDATSLAPRDLYFAVGTPISYRNLLSNRAVSAITIYSKNRLAFFGRQQNTTDLALTRCGAVLYNTTTIPEAGTFVVPQTPNGYMYYIANYVDIYEGRKLGQFVIELESIPTYQNTSGPLDIPFDYQVDLSGYPGAQYFVYDAGGTIFFSSDAPRVGTNLTRSLPQEFISGNGIADQVPKYTIYHQTLYKQHLFVAIIVPNAAIHNGLGHSQLIFLLSVCTVSLVLLFIILFVSGRLSAPLRTLAQYCISTRDHPETPPVFDPGFREIADAQEAFAARATQIQDMQSVIMKNHLKMKDNEIQLLQSQINPHFLFNMLDIIGWQAAQDENKNISEMITHLGRLLRNNILLNNQEKITIGQEVQYIRDYLALEQIRHAGRFTYTIDTDEDLLASCYIPKLSLQPIVENCIIHGFHGLARPGAIEVRIWDDMDNIICTVRDNGVGFDATDYFKKTASRPPDAKRSHIALHNIQDRIHMLCGPQYGITIESRPGDGTLVKVMFPLDEKGEA